MRKNSVFFIFFTIFIFLGYQVQAYNYHEPSEERIYALFPDKFTQFELDRLRDQQPVLRGDLVYSMDAIEAQKLIKQYPYKTQIITSYGFADRVVKKSSYVQIEDNYNARALYGVQSPYSKIFDDKKGFYIKVERIIDTYLPLLDKQLDQTNSTSLIFIKDFDEQFIHQTIGHDYQRLMNNLAKLIIVLNALDGNVFSGSVEALYQLGKELLMPYITQKIGKNIPVDQGAIMEPKDIVIISTALKEDIFQKIGVNFQSIPQLPIVQSFLIENTLLEHINKMPLLERYERNDPSLIKIDLFSEFKNLQDTKEKEIQILSLFPDHFTQIELDRLKDLKPVFKDDLVYSLDEIEAGKLYANYPSKLQIISMGGFSERVVKSNKIIIESDHVAYANYVVKSAYSKKFDDIVGFNIKVKRVIDAMKPLLGFSTSGEDLDSQKATALIQIKELDRHFVRGNEFVLGNGYDKRLNTNLAKFLLLFRKLEGDVFNGTYDQIIPHGRTLLRAYILKRIKKDVAVDEDVLMDEEDFYIITDLLKQTIYQKIGINAHMIPSLEDYQVNFLAELGDDWLMDVTSKSFEERYEHNDPALLKVKLLRE